MLKSTARLGQAMIVYALTECCWADQLLPPNTQKLDRARVANSSSFTVPPNWCTSYTDLCIIYETLSAHRFAVAPPCLSPPG